MDISVKVTIAAKLVEILEKFGVKTAFGVSGGFIVPLWNALSQSTIQTIHCRHESGGVFSASEYSLYKDLPTVAFSTAGPGITNALTGLKAAKLDGAKLIFISAITVEKSAGRWGLQETDTDDIAALVGNDNRGFFDQVVIVNSKETLIESIYAIGKTTNPRGGVIGIFISSHVQKMIIDWDEKDGLLLDAILGSSEVYSVENEIQQTEIARVLSTGHAILWNGFGCRHAADIIKKIVLATNTKVLSTPRGKGVFPENHPLYIATTGLGADIKKIRTALADSTLTSIVILGSRLGELSTSYLQFEITDKKIYYIGLQENITANLPQGAIIIPAEINRFLQGVYEKIPPTKNAHTDPIPINHAPLITSLDNRGTTDEKAGISPLTVMAIVQQVAINELDCLIAAEAGNSFVWANRYLSFEKSNRYKVCTSLGAMAHYACALVGLAATGKTTLGIIGDGAMLMNNEVNTAVRYALPAVWLVMNDGTYNMCRQGLNLLGYPPLDCEIPGVDFGRLATALGAEGVSVTNSSTLAEVLRNALMRRKPTIIDVHIDKEAVPPFLERMNTIKSL